MKFTRPYIPPHLLRDIILDAWALVRAGRWHEARERMSAAAAECRERVRHRSIGAAMAPDQMTLDIARTLGIDLATVRRIADEALFDTPPHAVAKELADMRRESRGA